MPVGMGFYRNNIGKEVYRKQSEKRDSQIKFNLLRSYFEKFSCKNLVIPGIYFLLSSMGDCITSLSGTKEIPNIEAIFSPYVNANIS